MEWGGGRERGLLVLEGWVRMERKRGTGLNGHLISAGPCCSRDGVEAAKGVFVQLPQDISCPLLFYVFEDSEAYVDKTKARQVTE